jgi:hypothetical protein
MLINYAKTLNFALLPCLHAQLGLLQHLLKVALDLLYGKATYYTYS